MFQAAFMCFSLYLGIGCGGGGGGSQGIISTQPAYAVFTVASSKIEVCETYFFDTVIT